MPQPQLKLTYQGQSITTIPNFGITSSDNTYWITDDCKYYTTTDISCCLPKEEKRYFFPTNCVNCGNVLDKEGHCSMCGTWHNPTMVV